MDENLVIDGGVTTITDANGGADTYTVSPLLAANVTINDTDGATINLPAGLDVTAAVFSNTGVEFTVNGFTVTILTGSNDEADLLTFVFGGDPLDTTAGTPLTFEGTAAAFGAASPDTLGPTDTSDATETGSINPDGTVGDPDGSEFTIAATAGDSVDEGGVGDANVLSFTVTRAGDLTESASVNYAVTGSGTDAADAADFVGGTLPSGQVTFAAGEATATIDVAINGDLDVEPDEGFTVTLENPSDPNTIGDPASADGTILNDDVPFTLTASDDQVAEGDTVTYTVTLPAAAVVATTVAFNVIPGDATAADQGTGLTNLNDFAAGTFNPQTATIGVGETSTTFSVQGKVDGLTELPETFSVEATIGTDSITETTTLLDGSATGQIFTLTTSSDALPGLVGSNGDTSTAGNDTIVGSNTTLGAADVLDGGTGDDVLRYASSGDENVTESGFTTTNIQTFEVTSDVDAGKSTTFDVTNATGVTSLINNNSSADLTLTGLSALTDITLQNVTGGDTQVTYKDAVLTGTSDEQTLILDSVADNAGDPATTITVGKASDNDGGVEVVNVQTTGGASALVDLVTGAPTINVSGDQDLTIQNILEDATTIDASAFLNDLSVVADSGAEDVVVTGGDGDDTADFSAGFDAGDTFAGGDGINTIILNNATATGTPGGSLTQVQVLQISDGGNGTIDMADFAGVSKVIFDDGLDAATTVDNASDGIEVEVDVDSAVAQDLTIDLATDGTGDEATLTLDVFNSTDVLGTVDVEDAETLNVSTDDETTGGDGALTINTLDAEDLTDLVISGDADLTIGATTTETTDALTSVDASTFTGDLDIDVLGGGASGLTVVSGTGDDQITGSGTADNIDAGDGDDTITGSVGQDTLTGGAGNDTFTYNNSTESTGSAVDTITDFARGSDIIDLTDLDDGPGAGIVSSSQFLGVFGNETTANTALTATGTGGPNQAVFLSNINALVVDSNGSGDIDTGDFLVTLTGITDFDAADLGLGSGGVTFTADTAGFNTATAADSVENNAVTNDDDVINATVAQLVGSTTDGLLGTDIFNITGTGAADLQAVGFTNIATVTLGPDVTGVTLDEADTGTGQVTTLTGDSTAAQTLTIVDGTAPNADDLTGVTITDVETLIFGTAASNITIDEGNLASFETAITGSGGADTLTFDSTATGTGAGEFDFSSVLLTGVETLALGDGTAFTFDAADLNDVTAITAGAGAQTLTLNDADDLTGITTTGTVGTLAFGDFVVNIDSDNLNIGSTAITGGGGAAAELEFDESADYNFSAIALTNVSILDLDQTSTKDITVDVADLADVATIDSTAGNDNNDLKINDAGDLGDLTISGGVDEITFDNADAGTAQTLTITETVLEANVVTISSAGGSTNDNIVVNPSAAGSAIDFSNVATAANIDGITINDGTGVNTITFGDNDAVNNVVTVNLANGDSDIVDRGDTGAIADGGTNALTIQNFSTGIAAGADQFTAELNGTAFAGFETITTAGTNIAVAQADTIFEIESSVATVNDFATGLTGGAVETAILTAFGNSTDAFADNEFGVLVYGSGAAAGDAALYLAITDANAAALDATNTDLELIAVFDDGIAADSFVLSNFI